MSLSLEELMDVEIVSASRQTQKINETGIPVSIVTDEDIHYSGLTNLYEVLQFSPGIDMVQVDRNKYALGVRGLHEAWSDRTLTLINGRHADSPTFGGSEFLRQPLLLEDIRQIEVLRGPSGGAWGANAFNGAINVLTKQPEDCERAYASIQVNEFNDEHIHMRWADRKDKWTWRLSGGYEGQVSSSQALDQQFPTTAGAPGLFTSRDFRRSSLVDSDVHYSVSETTTLSLGLGYQNMELGDHDFLYVWPQRDGAFRTTRGYAKLHKQIDPNTSGTLQWYTNLADTHWPSICQTDTLDNQLEGQLELTPAKDHRLSVGANLRLTDIDQRVTSPDDAMLSDMPERERRVGIFCVDRWDQSERLDVEAQGYGEWYSETGTDWAGRLSALYSLDDEGASVLRLSGAKSYRTPLVGLRHLSVSHFGGAVRVLEGGDLNNEHIWSLEAGYHYRIAKQAVLNLNAYWQQYRDVIGYVKLPTGFQPQNAGHAKADGAEVELALQPGPTKLSFWYAYNWFEVTSHPKGISSSQEVRAYLPARHKAGTTLRFFLPCQCVANLNAKYNSKTMPRGPLGDELPEFFRLDLTLAKTFSTSTVAGEIMLGVTDLFNETERVVSDHGVYVTQHITPGQTYFLRASLQF